MRAYVIALMLTLVVGCTTVPGIDTPLEAIAAAEAERAAAYQTTTRMLERGSIDVEQAKRIDERLDRAGEVLDTARRLIEAGCVGDAEQRLGVAESTLTAVEQELAQ